MSTRIFVTRRFSKEITQALQKHGLETVLFWEDHNETEDCILGYIVYCETVYDPRVMSTLDGLGFLCDGDGCVYPKLDIAAICKDLNFTAAETHTVTCILAHGEAYLSEEDISLMTAYRREKIARQQCWRNITQKARYLWGER